jgi:hypothetical protein
MKDKKITVETKGEEGKRKPTASATGLSTSRDPVGSGQGGHGLTTPTDPQETQEKPKDKPKK